MPSHMNSECFSFKNAVALFGENIRPIYIYMHTILILALINFVYIVYDSTIMVGFKLELTLDR